MVKTNRAIEQREDARRWSAAWKRAAKHEREETELAVDFGNAAYDIWKQAMEERDDARDIARRLLKERDLWQDTVEMRDASIRHLESDRDALAAENKRLRDLNKAYPTAAEQWSKLVDNNKRLRECLEMVEWVGKACPWCRGLKVYPGAGHSPDCKRQKALGLVK